MTQPDRQLRERIRGWSEGSERLLSRGLRLTGRLLNNCHWIFNRKDWLKAGPVFCKRALVDEIISFCVKCDLRDTKTPVWALFGIKEGTLMAIHVQSYKKAHDHFLPHQLRHVLNHPLVIKIGENFQSGMSKLNLNFFGSNVDTRTLFGFGWRNGLFDAKHPDRSDIGNFILELWGPDYVHGPMTLEFARVHFEGGPKPWNEDERDTVKINRWRDKLTAAQKAHAYNDAIAPFAFLLRLASSWAEHHPGDFVKDRDTVKTLKRLAQIVEGRELADVEELNNTFPLIETAAKSTTFSASPPVSLPPPAVHQPKEEPTVSPSSPLSDQQALLNSVCNLPEVNSEEETKHQTVPSDASTSKQGKCEPRTLKRKRRPSKPRPGAIQRAQRSRVPEVGEAKMDPKPGPSSTTFTIERGRTPVQAPRSEPTANLKRRAESRIEWQRNKVARKSDCASDAATSQDPPSYGCQTCKREPHHYSECPCFPHAWCEYCRRFGHVVWACKKIAYACSWCKTRGHYMSDCPGFTGMADHFLRFEEYADSNKITSRRFENIGVGFFWHRGGTGLVDLSYEEMIRGKLDKVWAMVVTANSSDKERAEKFKASLKFFRAQIEKGDRGSQDGSLDYCNHFRQHVKKGMARQLVKATPDYPWNREGSEPMEA